MDKEKSQVFLVKIGDKIKNGDYDKEFTIPFMTKELVYFSIKARVDKKLETKATPLLTDAEIKDAIKDAKETATITASLFIKNGILIKGVDGYELSSIAKKAIRL